MFGVHEIEHRLVLRKPCQIPGVGTRLVLELPQASSRIGVLPGLERPRGLFSQPSQARGGGRRGHGRPARGAEWWGTQDALTRRFRPIIKISKRFDLSAARFVEERHTTLHRHNATHEVHRGIARRCVCVRRGYSVRFVGGERAWALWCSSI